MKRSTGDSSLRCSFCHKRHNDTRKLISSPSDYPRAYICDECVAVCAAIFEDDRVQVEQTGEEMDLDSPHPMLAHPLASRLMGAIESWVREESLGKDGLAALHEVRTIAKEVFQT